MGIFSGLEQKGLQARKQFMRICNKHCGLSGIERHHGHGLYRLFNCVNMTPDVINDQRSCLGE